MVTVSVSIDVESARSVVIVIALPFPLKRHLVLPVARPSLLGALLPLVRPQLSLLRGQLLLAFFIRSGGARLLLTSLLLFAHGLVVFERFEQLVPLAMVGDVL